MTILTRDPKILSFRSVGRPAPQGSKTSKGGGNFTEASRYLSAWRERVTLDAARAAQARGWQTTDSPVGVAISFTVLVPTAPPDTDKLARAVLDSLTKAKIYRDDALVVRLITEKIPRGTHSTSIASHPWSQCDCDPNALGAHVTIARYPEL